MDQHPFFSIIIPVYKVEEYLNECITSVVSQSFENFEIILVDDGSPDNCPAICDAWATKDNRIQVIHKENGGLSDARNQGLQVAKGEYVWFVDSDDWITDNTLDNLAASIRLFADVEMIALQLIGVRENVKKIYGEYPSFPTIPLQISNIQYIEYKYLLYPVSRYLIKREVLISNNLTFINNVLHEDIPFGHMLIALVKTVVLLPQPAYCYRIRNGSIATTPNIKSCYSLLLSHKIIMKFMNEKVHAEDKNWFLNLTYDYFHEFFIKLYPFVCTNEYKKIMNENIVYIKKEFNKLWSVLSIKRKLLLISFNISPKLFSYLLAHKYK